MKQLNETSSDDGKTWTVSYDFTHKRKKASTGAKPQTVFADMILKHSLK